MLGIRWNGASDKVAGTPQSRGYATWFILPDEFDIAILQTLIVKQAMGNSCIMQDSLNEALSWVRESGKMSNIQYVVDKNGKKVAVQIPI